MPEEAQQSSPIVTDTKEDIKLTTSEVSAARSKGKLEFTNVKNNVFKAVAEAAKEGAKQLKEDAKLGKEVNELSRIENLALGKKISDKKEELNYEKSKEIAKSGGTKGPGPKGPLDIKLP